MIWHFPCNVVTGYLKNVTVPPPVADRLYAKYLKMKRGIGGAVMS
jgi:hypothetical protein